MESFLVTMSEVWVRQKGVRKKSSQSPSSPKSLGHPEELHKQRKARHCVELQ